ncbi:HNH endonuclease [Vibrio alginolyticus]
MDSCYLCGEVFNESDVLKHDEHIIQQAIGGTLTSDSVLCKSCGENLGNTVDVPFNMMFDSICTRLDIKKDRGNKKKGTAKGVIFGKGDCYGNDLSGIEVFWRDSKVTPVIPIHRYTPDEKKVIVYADGKQLKNYLKKVKSELDEKYDDDFKPDIIICDDITGVVTYPLELNNESFKKGLAKIAIGFASKSNINRKTLNLALDCDLRKIKENISLLQFYPKGVFDEIIERDKKDIRYYPSHTLILFTAASNSNLLVCYIELFSTFQWYVILSDKYDGDPIYASHHQRVDKGEDYIFKPDRRYYKDREMILSSLGIKQERINNAYEKQKGTPNEKSIEEIEYKIIQEEHMKQKYHVDFDREVEIAIGYASQKLMEQRSINTLINLKPNMDLFYSYDENNEDIFNPSSYRRLYISDGKPHDYIYSLIEYYETEEGRKNQKEYGHKKFYMLSNYMEMKTINEKLEL